jgi:glycerol-3-phosphate acyltransferase PlsY
LAAFTGHLFPVWIGFRGGKGVATFLGILLALNWIVGLAACATWLVVVLFFRISSLGGLSAAALAPIWIIIQGDTKTILLAILLGLLVFIRHRENIKRILAGTEPKVGRKKNGAV